MSTHSPMMKLVRWRVRDLAACFYACKIPRIDEEPNCSTATHHMARKTMVFDPIGERRRRQNDGQKRGRKGSNQVKASFESSKQSTNSKISADGSLCFKEEEYLVFCFRDDGTIHMVNEKRPSEASIASNTITHTCDEVAQKNSSPSHVDVGSMDDKEIISANAELGTSLSNEQQVDGEGSNDIEVVYPADEIKEINHNESQECKTVSTEGKRSTDAVVWPSDEIKEINQTESREGKTLSSMLSVVESSDSNQSDAGSSSFAFPVLRWEWMGSPVHMPKPEDIGLRAQKGRGVCLQCCGF